MKKIIYNRFAKEWMAELPKVTYDKNIFVIVTPEQTEKAVDYLLSMPILGVDTETRPSFTKRQQFKCSLLQVATHHNCFLFRLNFTGMTAAIIRLLEDTTITKVGLSLQDDMRGLNQRRNFTPGTFVELQKEVKDIGIEDNSLQKIYANLFGGKIAKGQQLSNWEADILTEAQQRYAATDAWICVMMYKALLASPRL